MRIDERKNDELRKITVVKNYLPHAEGSVLICFGNTHVVCAASVEEKVPPFQKAKAEGWVTAEYGMLPRSTGTRMRREVSAGKPSGRTQEIQRLIGRSLRGVTNLKKLGERQITIDCDVIRADGGTRTASISGGFIALALAIEKLMQEEKIKENPLISYVGAISAGIWNGQPLLDLNYHEDSSAEVDFNVIMNEKGEYIEIQGTAEGVPFNKEQRNSMLDLSEKGIKEIIQTQKEIIGDFSQTIA
ncbi:MAG: ribonuclease PH [Nitrospinae bacterium]|nr:ribonuclease PH [Nitrospinota bacterium]